MFPLVLIKLENDPLYDETLDKQDQQFKVTFEVEIYTVDTTKDDKRVMKQVIRKELTKLVNDVLDEHFGFRRLSNRNVPNLDSNIDRQHLRYRGIVNESGTIFRK